MEPDVAGKVIDAYRSSPLLGALFLLNVLIFVGAGWYLWDKETKTGKFIMQMQEDAKELRLEAMRLAASCATRPSFSDVAPRR